MRRGGPRARRPAPGMAPVLLERDSTGVTAGKQARSALELFTPGGRPNDRAQAGAIVAAALPHSSGAGRAKARGSLLRRKASRPRIKPEDGCPTRGRTATSCRRRRPWRRSAATRAGALVCAVRMTKACPDRPGEACRVRAVRRDVWRASRLVECVHRVAQMQQARHRKMTQGYRTWCPFTGVVPQLQSLYNSES